MPFDIGDALSQGLDRTIKRNGLLLAGLFFVVSVLSVLVVPRSAMGMGAFQPDIPPGGGPPPFEPPSLGVLAAIVGLSLLFGLVQAIISIGALRTFVDDETERLASEAFTRNLVWALLNLIVGGIVFGIAVAIGFVFLVIPGLFLLVSLYFWSVYVVVEDQNFVEGLGNSWNLTKGHRLRLFGLGVVVAVISFVISILFGLPAFVLPETIGLIISQIGSAITTVFTLATTARAYVQLTSAESPATAPDEPVGADPI